MFKKVCFLLIFLIMISAPSLCFSAGSGAYRLEVPDAAACGKGSAFVGEANNPSAVYYNPAGLTQLVGNAISFGAAWIQPHVKYTSSSGEQTKMEVQDYGIPHAYFVSDLGMRDFVFGIGVVSSYGLGTDWHWSGENFLGQLVTTEAEMTNQDYLMTGAYRLTDQWSIAVGLDIDQSQIDKRRTNKTYWSEDRLKAKSTAVGYRIATMYRLNDQHQFGLMYRSEIKHKYKGDLTTNLGGGPFTIEAQTRLTLPQSIVAGYSFRPTAKWTINMDIEWTDWRSIDEDKVVSIGGVETFKRDWKDVFSFAIGTQYDLTSRFRLRTGYYYHDSPVPDSTWEPAIPDSESHGITFGFGYDVTEKLILDLACSGILYQKRRINNTVGSGLINGEYRQYSFLAYGTLTYKF